MTSVKFGLTDDIDFNTNSATINAFYPIRYREYLASTKSGLFRFENDIIKKVYPYKFATSILIPEYKFIVGISFLGGELSVISLDELENPIFSHFKTNQLNIFHIIYSNRSHSLITVGSGIKVWNFNVKTPRKVTLINKPEITITLRAQIAPEYNTPILNPPSIDFDQELLYLPTSNGFCGYDLDGKEKKLFSKIDSTPQTAASLCLENKKFITSSQIDGFHVWSQKGYLINKIPGGMSSIMALRFINKHFALFLDSNFWLFIIDIKTNNIFHCLTISSKPNFFNVYRDSNNGKYYLIISQGSIAKKMEIVLPWTVWKKMTTQPCSIRRCPKFKEAARILTYYKSSIFSFLSPKDGKNLTSAVDTQPSGPLFHYYDRGLFLEPIFDESNSFISHTNVIEIFPESKRDVLFVTTAEANTSLFSTGNNPCDLIKIIEIQISSITVCEVDDTFMYCFSNSQGELLFYNYSDFSRHSRKLILKKLIKRIFYHRKSSSILIIFQDEIHLFDLKTFKDIQKISIKDGNCSEFYGNLLLIGCKNGNIESFRIDFLKGSTNYTLKRITDECIHYHDDEVTSFSFSSSFFISSSLDKTVKIWNYNFNLIFDIVFPFPLFSCEILNTKRDILVGTDNEILKIDGLSLFDSNSNDPEVVEIDNYDKISDELTNQLIQFAVEKNKDEQSDFLSNRNKNKNDEESSQKVAQSKIPKIRNFNTNNENNFDEKEENNNKKAQANTELSEEERNRRLYEMNLINERSDNEKLQAKLRAEMKMKKDEEERKRKLREAEEAKRRELEENQNEEEEEKQEGKGKRKKRRKVRHQKPQIEEPQPKSNKYDDIDDFLFKPKKPKENNDSNEQDLYQRPKAVYKPKQRGPRPSRPYRSNTQHQNQSNENEYEEEDEYDENDEYGYNYDDYEDEDGNNSNKKNSHKKSKNKHKSDSKNHKQKRKQKRDTKEDSTNLNDNNEDSNINQNPESDETNDKKRIKKKIKIKISKRKSKNKQNGTDDDDYDGYEYYGYEYQYEYENDMLNENHHNTNYQTKNNKTKNDQENEEEIKTNNDENEEIESENEKVKNKNNKSEFTFGGEKISSEKPQKAEADTQTEFENEKNRKTKSTFDSLSNKKETANKKAKSTSGKVKQSNNNRDSTNNTNNEKSKNDKSNPNSQLNKKRSGTISKLSKQNSNKPDSTKESNKHNSKLTATTTNKEATRSNRSLKYNINNNNNNNIKASNSNDDKKSVKSCMSKNRLYRSHEQIFLNEKFKRSPTPPPDQKIYYTRNPIRTNFNSKTLNPSRPFTKFRKRNQPRRSRTPPVLEQEKLVLLPGPEIVFDREAIIDRILDGEVELMPLLKRLILDDKSYTIQRLKQSYNCKINGPRSALTQPRPQNQIQSEQQQQQEKEKQQQQQQQQFHNLQFEFPSSSIEDDREIQNNCEDDFLNRNCGFFRSVKESNMKKPISSQFSYPPYSLSQQQNQMVHLQQFPLPSKFLPLIPNSKNLNPRNMVSQKVESEKVPLLGEDEFEHLNDAENQQNGDYLSFRKEKFQKNQKQHQVHQVSILNLGFEPQHPAPPPLNFATKREIVLPSFKRPGVKTKMISPRRNQLKLHTKVPLFEGENEVEGEVLSKSTENFAQAKIGPLPQRKRQEGHMKNRYQKLMFAPVRNSSPPPLYRPRIYDKAKNNTRLNRYTHQ